MAPDERGMMPRYLHRWSLWMLSQRDASDLHENMLTKLCSRRPKNRPHHSTFWLSPWQWATRPLDFLPDDFHEVWAMEPDYAYRWFLIYAAKQLTAETAARYAASSLHRTLYTPKTGFKEKALIHQMETLKNPFSISWGGDYGECSATQWSGARKWTTFCLCEKSRYINP